MSVGSFDERSRRSTGSSEQSLEEGCAFGADGPSISLTIPDTLASGADAPVVAAHAADSSPPPLMPNRQRGSLSAGEPGRKRSSLSGHGHLQVLGGGGPSPSRRRSSARVAAGSSSALELLLVTLSMNYELQSDEQLENWVEKNLVDLAKAHIRAHSQELAVLRKKALAAELLNDEEGEGKMRTSSDAPSDSLPSGSTSSPTRGSSKRETLTKAAVSSQESPRGWDRVRAARGSLTKQRLSVSHDRTKRIVVKERDTLGVDDGDADEWSDVGEGGGGGASGSGNGFLSPSAAARERGEGERGGGQSLERSMTDVIFDMMFGFSASDVPGLVPSSNDPHPPRVAPHPTAATESGREGAPVPPLELPRFPRLETQTQAFYEPDGGTGSSGGVPQQRNSQQRDSIVSAAGQSSASVNSVNIYTSPTSPLPGTVLDDTGGAKTPLHTPKEGHLAAGGGGGLRTPKGGKKNLGQTLSTALGKSPGESSTLAAMGPLQQDVQAFSLSSPPSERGTPSQSESASTTPAAGYPTKPPAAVEGFLKPLSLRRQIHKAKYIATESQLAEERYQHRMWWLRMVFEDACLFFAFFNSACVAAHIGLGSEEFDWSPEFLIFEAAADVLFFLFNFVRLVLPFEERGAVITNVKKCAKRYLRTPSLGLFDLISSFPILLFVLLVHGTGAQGYHLDFARVNILLRSFRVPEHMDMIQLQFPSTIHPTIWRLIFYFFSLILIVFTISGFYMLMLREAGIVAAKSWLQFPLHPINADPTLRFTQMFWMSMVIISDKSLPFPQTDSQFVFALIAISLGVIVICILIASVEEIVVDIIQHHSVLSNKIEDTLGALGVMRVDDPELIDEIVLYYHRMWHLARSFDYENLADKVSDLPELLRDELDYETNVRLLQNIPLFHNIASNEDFVRRFAGELHQCVVLPGAPIVTRGEEGDCMFFLNSGTAAVLEGGSEEIVREVAEGAFFGEVAVLFGCRHPNSIVALTTCTCSVITDTQFEGLVDAFPEALQAILEEATKQMEAAETAVDFLDGMQEDSDVAGLALDSDDDDGGDQGREAAAEDLNGSRSPGARKVMSPRLRYIAFSSPESPKPSQEEEEEVFQLGGGDGNGNGNGEKPKRSKKVSIKSPADEELARRISRPQEEALPSAMVEGGALEGFGEMVVSPEANQGLMPPQATTTTTTVSVQRLSGGGSGGGGGGKPKVTWSNLRTRFRSKSTAMQDLVSAAVAAANKESAVGSSGVPDAGAQEQETVGPTPAPATGVGVSSGGAHHRRSLVGALHRGSSVFARRRTTLENENEDSEGPFDREVTGANPPVDLG